MSNPVVSPKTFATHHSAICPKRVTFTSVIAKANSGASCHYFRPQDAPFLCQLQSVPSGPAVCLPDDMTITSNQKGLLPLSTTLSDCAKTVPLFPHLRSASLVSLGQLCDDDCVVILDKNKIIVKKDNKIALKGHHNPTDGLWDISLTTIQRPKSSRLSIFPSAPSTFQHRANVIIRKNQTTKELTNYLHAACGSPAISTSLQAIKDGFFHSWPGINLIKQSDITPSIATAKGHLDQA